MGVLRLTQPRRLCWFIGRLLVRELYTSLSTLNGLTIGSFSSLRTMDFDALVVDELGVARLTPQVGAMAPRSVVDLSGGLGAAPLDGLTPLGTARP